MPDVIGRYAVRTTVSVVALAAAGNAAALEWEVGDAKIDLYGFARLNAAFDVDQDATSDFGTQTGSFNKTVENDRANRDGGFGADAEQSRLGVTVKHDTGVRVTVEGDYRGGDFRLRKAYGEYEGILAGQTWSNYNTFVGYTPSVDFDALAGLAGLQDRVAQVRYTIGSLSVAIEEPIPSGRPLEIDRGGNDVPASDRDDFSRDELPTLTARYESSIDAFSYSVAGVVQQVNGNQAETNLISGDAEDDMLGGAAFVAGSYQATEALTLNATFNVSEGANTYLYRSGDDFGAADGYFDGDDLEPISGYGGSIGASYKIGQGSVNLGIGSVTNDWDEVEDDRPTDTSVQSEHETNTNALVNYMWRPADNMMYGVEYQYLDVELQSGESFDANRAMFAAQYSF